MGWKIEFFETASKQFRKLDRQWQIKILSYLEEILSLQDPRQRGKALTGKKSGLWRYRVGDYRVICEIQGQALRILVLEIGHRKNVYD